MVKKSRPIDTGAEFVAKDFVYTGLRWSTNEQRLVTIRCIDADGKLEPPMLFEYNRKYERVIGGVYTGAAFTADGSVRGLITSGYSELWPNIDDRLEWKVADERVKSEHRCRAAEKDEKRISEIETILMPLRTTYETFRVRRDFAGMEALEASVLRSLRSAPRVSEK